MEGSAPDRPADTPSQEFSDDAADVKAKRGRGRPRKDGSAPRSAPAGGRTVEAVTSWDPEIAGLLLKAPHDLAAALTGCGAFSWTDAEVEPVKTLLASVLDDALPYQGYRVKLALLVVAIATIDAMKFRTYSQWRAAQKAAPVEPAAPDNAT